MTRAFGVSLALVLVWAAHPASLRQTSAPLAASSLVGTWTLTTLEQGTGSGGQPARVANPRGLLVLDGAGHAFEFVTSAAAQRVAGGQVPVAEAPAAFCIVRRLLGAIPGGYGAEDNYLSPGKRRASADRRHGDHAIVRARREPPDPHVHR